MDISKKNNDNYNEVVLANELAKVDKRVNQWYESLKEDLEEILECEHCMNLDKYSKYIDIQVHFSNECGCKLPWICGEKEGECETSAEKYLSGPDDLKHGTVKIGVDSFNRYNKNNFKYNFKYDLSKKVFKKFIDDGYDVRYVRKSVFKYKESDKNKRKFWNVYGFKNYFRFCLNKDKS